MSTDVRVVLMTAPDRETGERLGRALVEARAAACANVLPGVTSIYWWEGAVERADEVLVVLKATEAGVPALVERATALHPYDVPEVLALPVDAGSGAYLAWVRAEAGAGEGSR